MVRMECPAWFSGGLRLVIAGCLSLQRLGVGLPLARPVWDSNLGRPAASESRPLCQLSYRSHHAGAMVSGPRTIARLRRSVRRGGASSRKGRAGDSWLALSALRVSRVRASVHPCDRATVRPCLSVCHSVRPPIHPSVSACTSFVYLAERPVLS